jgi:hypothetical protein
MAIKTNGTEPFYNPLGGKSEFTLQYNSFSGTDIKCFFFGDNIPTTIEDIDSSPSLTAEEKIFLKGGALNDRNNRGSILPFGELQTLTVSSSRSYGPVRRLGEHHPQGYKGGARTIAGSLVFALMNRDVFAAYMRGLIPGAQSNSWSSPSFVDEIPPFNILIEGGNEYGSVASALLIGVQVTNFGSTFSIDDMYTESTYTYVANHYIPFVEDWQETFFRTQALIGDKGIPVLSSSYVNDQVPIDTRGGGIKLIPREMWSWLQSLPERARERIKDNIDKFLELYNKPKSNTEVKERNIFDRLR